MKKIHNIVFYDFIEYGVKRIQSCIFYEDGTVKNVTYEDGLKACEEVVKEKNISSKKAFQEMINRDLVHVLHMDEFLDTFANYSTKNNVVTEINEKDTSKVSLDETKNINDSLESTRKLDRKKVEVMAASSPLKADTTLVKQAVLANEDFTASKNTEVKKEGFFNKLGKRIAKSSFGRKLTAISVSAAMMFGGPLGLYSAANKNSLVGKMTGSNIAYAQGFDEDELGEDTESLDTTSYEVTNISGDVQLGETDYTESTISDVSYSYDESHNSTDESYDYTDYSYEETGGIIDYTEDYTISGSDSIHYVSEGEMASGAEVGYTYTTGGSTGYTEYTGYTGGNTATRQTSTGCKKVCYEESKTDYSLCELLQLTTCKFQRKAMYHLANALRDYNIRFARCYVEEGKDIKASLTFEEMVALQIAYNNFTDQEIQAYFNGVKVKASTISAAYKDAATQLMGAYIIEDSESALDMSILIESEEGKEFYHRYHKMFLAIKDSKSTDERIARLEEFYQQVRTDFKLTDGQSIEGYKLSVAPMVAATLMLYQDLDINFELSDTELAFLNDVGLTKYADATFARVEKITMNSCVDKTNPTFKQFRTAIINMLKEKCSKKTECTHKTNNNTCVKVKNCSPVVYTYVTNNCYRNLSGLESYQQKVKWTTTYDESHEWSKHISKNCPIEWKKAWEQIVKFTVDLHEEETTAVEKIAWTETETKYHEVIEEVEKDIPENIKKQIDEQIECDNRKAYEEALIDSEKVRQELQLVEDKKAEQIEEEIKQEEIDLQEKINEANNQIDLNHDGDPSNDKKVNESDLGHGVDFFDDYSDKDGNLDNSVENITTDKTGDQTGMDLPDPNVTGSEFDKEGNKLPVDGTGNETIDEGSDYFEYVSEDSDLWDTIGGDTTGQNTTYDYTDDTTTDSTGDYTFDYSGDDTTDYTGGNGYENLPEDSNLWQDVDDDYSADDSSSVQERVSYDYSGDTSDDSDYSNDSDYSDYSGDTSDDSDYSNDSDYSDYSGYVEYVADDDSAYIEYPTDYTPYVEQGGSNEDIVNTYVETMATDTQEEANDVYAYSM